MQAIDPQGLVPPVGTDPLVSGAEAAGAVPTVQAPSGSTLTSMGNAFDGELERAAAALDPQALRVAEVVLQPLNSIDREATALGDLAKSTMADGETLSPGEMIELSMRSQEFMFHSQLTANVANRTADGLSQLFRQQG